MAGNESIINCYVPRTEAPFHLCSIQPFFFLIFKWSKSERLKQTLYRLTFPTCLFGASISLILCTVECSFINPQSYEYFIFHGALVVYAITMYKKRLINVSLAGMFQTMILLLILFLASIPLNSVLSDTGLLIGSNQVNLFYTNFFYSLRPPLDGLPVLNLKYGWYVYFIHMVICGMLLIAACYLPLYIIKRIKQQKGNN